MKAITHFLARFQRRTLLMAVAVLLIIVNLGVWVNDAYDTRQEEVESKTAQLAQYQLVSGKGEVFAERLDHLLALKEKVGQYFFTGEDDNKLSSAMQLRVQALVAKAGLQAESIRPTMHKADSKQDKDGAGGAVLGEVLIKVRLAGTIHEFMDFLAELYRGKEFFEIESISLKPYRKTGLKIFIELKGYYIISGQSGNSGETEI
ncbi:MAG: type II secretion system protein GspM [Thermodesulfobacteriota bacterium]